MGNKTVGTNTFTGDANIEDAGNDWYRLSVTTFTYYKFYKRLHSRTRNR